MVDVSSRLFLDTSYVMAMYSANDEYHRAAQELASSVRNCRELWTSDAVLLEIAASFSHPNRRSTAVGLWDRFHGGQAGFHVVEAAGSMMEKAVDLYRARTDKSWSLADCL